MKKSVIAAFAAAVILVTTVGVQARVYDYTFTSPSEQMSGELTVDLSNNEVTGITGILSGAVADVINGVVDNSSFPSIVGSPDGLFIYNDLFYPGASPVLDVYGVLFTTAGNPSGYWNLWGNSPGSYSLYESSNGGYAFAVDGNLTVTAPEPSTWAMKMLGFASLGFAGARASRKSAALAA